MAELNMSEVIAKAVAEATKIAIQPMADIQVQQISSQHRPRLGSPALKQPTFNWKATDKYTESKAFMLEVQNVIPSYNIQEGEKITIIKNWIGRRGLQFIDSLTQEEKQGCETFEGLCSTFVKKFHPAFNETVKSLQFRKLCRLDGENAEAWMGGLRVAASKCNYKECDRQMKEQFIHGLVNKDMLDEIIKELTKRSSNKPSSGKDILRWAKCMEAQRAQAIVLNKVTGHETFDKVKVMPKTKTAHPTSLSTDSPR